MKPTAKQRIEAALYSIMSQDEANACVVWKGYDVATNETGWHCVPFGQTATFLGESLAEALEMIAQIAEERNRVFQASQSVIMRLA